MDLTPDQVALAVERHNCPDCDAAAPAAPGREDRRDKRGYRKDEPHGMKKREISQVLTKVFQGLRANGVRPAAVAGELGLTVDEMNKMLFGLTITMVEGGGEQTEREPRRALSLVN
ncbi:MULTISPECIES: hypothetical protein [unclassified Streptomyces]|uniref:hypothetical protein n=1 Tax=unclassified Streptomyces TaxID=2593676 RepID=UPI002DD88A06|nr:hypothetical protein [Streptomyces sp. NBC_01750]WSB02207.1 hypothetical protein OIE54_24725 [Streptomyces sp. NBC_01794]WSD33537.1 hypothetical protein OG966_17470 [Streptomyces sp. NBC_01750]